MSRKFYGDGNGLVFPPARPAAPATIPIVRQFVPAPPMATPAPPSTVASPAAGFPPYRFPAQVLGAPVAKVMPTPGLFDKQTAASFGPPTLSVPININPLPPQPRQGLSPPAAVVNNLSTQAARTSLQANKADALANETAKLATTAQKKADASIFAATTAQAKAATIPTPAFIGAAIAAKQRAMNDAAAAAAIAAKADNHDRQALQTAADAQAAIDRRNAALEQHVAANAAAVAQGDQTGAQDGQNWYDQGVTNYDPGQFVDGGPPVQAVPVQMPDGTVAMVVVKKPINPYVVGGAGAAAGFLFGGPVGALIGALLGGGGAYYVAKKSASMPAPSQAIEAAGTPIDTSSMVDPATGQPLFNSSARQPLDSARDPSSGSQRLSGFGSIPVYDANGNIVNRVDVIHPGFGYRRRRR